MEVIRVEHLYKQYQLGLVGTGTLTNDLNRWWHRVRGKEDPYLKVTAANDRTRSDDSEFVWALQDINFSVNQGEVLGIIGKNGAGKSTLLKILSKVTGPTSGNIKVKGRIASLLEVGTGFHPDLTGRENIFLNGAILGMTKHEIKSKFDEIVEFSGVQKYIDTPVKRYSSGMYVRLAFAVAAHLEPEILIVDEVLAVGDAEFQKKCLGKMKDVSGQGRTVLFVSHNMTAINSLCTKGIMLKNGKVFFSGNTEDVTNEYLKVNAESIQSKIHFENLDDAMGNDKIKIKCIEVHPSEIELKDEITISFEFTCLIDVPSVSLCFDLINIHEQIVFSAANSLNLQKGQTLTTKCKIPGNFLNDSIYKINIWFLLENTKLIYHKRDIIQFEVKEKSRDYAYLGRVRGVVRPVLKWEN